MDQRHGINPVICFSKTFRQYQAPLVIGLKIEEAGCQLQVVLYPVVDLLQ